MAKKGNVALAVYLAGPSRTRAEINVGKLGEAKKMISNFKKFRGIVDRLIDVNLTQFNYDRKQGVDR